MGLIFNSFYEGKKILITGHTGFKGSWLSIWLKEMGAEIIGIALPPATTKDIFVLAKLERKMRSYYEDIRNKKGLFKIFAEVQPEVVFHLAAQPLVLESYNDPVYTFETNILGTVNVLEACRKTKSVKQIVIVTTDKVYEEQQNITGYKESDPLGGHDPYSASKVGAEIVSQSYFRSFFNPNILIESGKSMATVRAGNVIGGGDWSLNRIVPDCIRALEEEKTVTIRNPGAIRPWQNVLEPISGYLKLAVMMNEDPVRYSGAWNFGPEEGAMVSVKDLIENIIICWGHGNWEIIRNNKKHHEAETLKLNINKSKTILGWKPVLSFNEAIEMAIYWYRNYSKNDVYLLSLNQIKEYSEKWNLRNKN
ncbi:MAG: CDP-glucose 4,6-dehydratase [Bacteroidales bacterium]|jgi:CDP-glucose 4,6-dehydratase|nr:CDP-glucose 4,6-dehydratase [Bacteroidales bacterium]